MPFSRRAIMVAATALALMGCSKSDGAATPAGGDMFLGAEKAPVTLIEYASTTCPHCAHFHETVFPGLKTKYIDSDKVKFVFREFPTPPEAIAVAEFQLARCAGKDKYFSMLDTFFKEQRNIMTAAQSPTGAKPALVAIARQAGLSEQQFDTCIADSKTQQAILDTAKAGAEQFKITGTPTLILDGEVMNGETHPEAYTIDGLSKLIDAKLAKAGAK
ncbi:MAG: DsbA family protein [Caulobacterales bacterium]